MNSAFTHHHTGRTAARLACHAVLACALVMEAGSALAQQRGDRRDDQGAPPQGQGQVQAQSPRFERFHLPPQERGQRQGDARGFEETRRVQEQRDVQRDAQRDSQREARRATSRMTADEKRDLRRQINEAGAEMYPQRQH